MKQGHVGQRGVDRLPRDRGSRRSRDGERGEGTEGVAWMRGSEDGSVRVKQSSSRIAAADPDDRDRQGVKRSR